MKKPAPAPAAVMSGLLVTGPAGPANAQTSPNDGDVRQRPERVRLCDVRDQNGDCQDLRHHGGTRDLAHPSGGGEGTAALTAVPAGRRWQRLGPESPQVFVIFIIRLAATVNVGKGHERNTVQAPARRR